MYNAILHFILGAVIGVLIALPIVMRVSKQSKKKTILKPPSRRPTVYNKFKSTEPLKK